LDRRILQRNQRLPGLATYQSVGCADPVAAVQWCASVIPTRHRTYVLLYAFCSETSPFLYAL